MVLSLIMQEVFELSHILYIVISLVLTVVGLVLIKKYCKTKKAMKIAIMVCAVVLLCVFIWNRLSLAIIEKDALKLMPYSYCSATTLLLTVFVLALKDRNRGVFHCVWYLAIIGPILTLIYPAFIIGIDTSIFATRTFSGLLHHSISLFLAVLLLISGEFKPNWRKLWCLGLGMCAYVAFGLFQIRALGFADSMEINRSFVEGTFLWWYVVGPMVLAGFFIITYCYERLAKKFKKK